LKFQVKLASGVQLELPSSVAPMLADGVEAAACDTGDQNRYCNRFGIHKIDPKYSGAVNWLDEKVYEK